MRSIANWKIWKSKIFWGLIILIVAVRMFLPPLILKKTNEFLAEFSPVYQGHLDDIDLGVWRGSYQLQSLELWLRKDPREKFFTTQNIDVSVAWREIFKGRLTTDIEIADMRFRMSKAVIDAFANSPKGAEEDSKKAGAKLFPVQVERIDFRDSSFEMTDSMAFADSPWISVTELRGRLSNAMPRAENPLSPFFAQGLFYGATPMKVSGTLNLTSDPVAWDLDAEMRDFELKKANPWLKKKLPLTFTSGELDLFSEVRSEKGKIEGYAKPFVKKADVVANDEIFVGLKHFGIEVSTAAANLFFRNARDKTLATKVLFAYDKDGIQINSAKAISEAFKNGFSDPLNEGLEDEISLSPDAQRTPQKRNKP